MHLYKYTSIDKAHEEYSSHIFTDHELYFSPLTELNDPFEASFNVQPSQDKRANRQFADMALKLQYPTLSRKERRKRAQKEGKIIGQSDFVSSVRKNMQQAYNTWGICCLSEVPYNVLMWSHYANKHRGFCLKYSTEQFYVEHPEGRTIPHKIHYTDQQPIARIIDEVAVRETLLTKAKQWEYEKEWRIVMPERIGWHPFPASCLTGVIFGYKMPEEHKDKIRLWCKDREPVIKYYQARGSENSYSLNIVEVP